MEKAIAIVGKIERRIRVYLRYSLDRLSELKDWIRHGLCRALAPEIDFDFLLRFPPGHFYTPLPSKKELSQIISRRKNSSPTLGGINLRDTEQFELYTRLSRWYDEMPFSASKQEKLTYYFANDYYSYSDAFYLYAMIREFSPKRIIEVGSGFSTCVMLDTNKLFLGDTVSVTCIEPNPERLFSLIGDEEKQRLRIFPTAVQDCDSNIFSKLEKGDFLFIDSSHVGKVGSDVLHIFHNILPVVKPGVLIHFHDVLFPFIYTDDWINKGYGWNESYFMHTFLQYNNEFVIKMFLHYFAEKYCDLVQEKTPLCLNDTGCSLWLERQSPTSGIA